MLNAGDKNRNSEIGGDDVVFRHEEGKVLPNLFTALSYQAIYGFPVSEIFPREYEEVRRGVLEDLNRNSEIDSSVVFRHEKGEELPDLLTALSYQVIEGSPVSELFPHEYEEVRRGVLGRMKELYVETGSEPKTDENIKKLTWIRERIGELSKRE